MVLEKDDDGNAIHKMAIDSGFELATMDEDPGARSPKRKLLQEIQILSFSKRKVVYGVLEEQHTSEVHLTYNILEIDHVASPTFRGSRKIYYEELSLN